MPELQSFLIADLDLDDMGQKELSTLVEKLTARITAIEKKIGLGTSESINGKRDKGFLVALVALVVSAVGLPIMLISWIEPHLQNDLKNDVKIEVGEQLKQPLQQINELAGDIREIKGKLEVLNPLIQQLIHKRISESKNLSPAELKNLVQLAKRENVKLDSREIKVTADKLLAESKTNPDAWNATLALLDYKSFVNPSLPNAPSSQISGTVHTDYEFTVPYTGASPPTFAVTGVVPEQNGARFQHIGHDTNEGRDSGNQFILGRNGTLQLDGMELRHVILIGVAVVYHGGPVVLDDVYFFNCSFTVDRGLQGEAFAKALLEPVPAASFKTA
jgi:hypothetical protein